MKPVTPSKIPVGSFRVEEEKAINRALNGHHDSNRQSSRASSPTPPSRIPKFSGASNYMRVKVGFVDFLCIFSKLSLRNMKKLKYQNCRRRLRRRRMRSVRLRGS